MSSSQIEITRSSAVVEWVLREHFNELSALLDQAHDPVYGLRAEAHLDGLRIAGEAALNLARKELTDPAGTDELAASVLVTLELGDSADQQQSVALLATSNLEEQEAVRRALRLANIKNVIPQLQALAQSTEASIQLAVADVLSFHRLECPVSLKPHLNDADPQIRVRTIEVMSRLKTFTETLFEQSQKDSDVDVRCAAWFAAAHAGNAALLALSREKAAEDEVALQFLGILGGKEDLVLIQKQLNGSLNKVALKSLGALGNSAAIPVLLPLLSDQDLGVLAARAFERLTGFEIPSSTPAPLNDEDDPAPLPQPKAAEEWWRGNGRYFSNEKRYQLGVDVSQNSLASPFECWPLNIQRDLYARERSFHGAQTSEWELETWRHRQRTPKWATEI